MNNLLDDFRSTYITWDKATRRIYSPISANESDSNGRKLNIQVVNSGQVENLTGATLHLYWETKDKAQHGLDAFTASDITKGEFEIFYTTGMLSNVGELNATLVLVDTTGKVVSDWFKITVSRGIDDDAIQSENSFSSLTQALIDISNLEQNYAPRLNNLTAQLQQTEQSLSSQLAQKAGLASLERQKNLLRTIKFENEDDGGQSWWTYPIVYRPGGTISDKTFFSFVNNNAETVIASLDNDSGEYESFPLLTDIVDEHNTAAIVSDNEGRIICAYARHNSDKFMRIRRSVGVKDISDFEPEILVECSGNVTYAQLYKTTKGFHLFYRLAMNGWAYRESADGVNWGGEVHLVQAPYQYYMKVVPRGTGGEFRLYMYGHPHAADEHSVRYGYIASTGEITTFGGLSLGETDGTGLPITHTSFSPIYTPAGSEKTRLFDAMEFPASAVPTVAIAEFTGTSSGTYKVVRYTGGVQQESIVAQTGKPLESPNGTNWYFAGIWFDPHSDNAVYLCRESLGVWYLERYETTDNFSTWKKTKTLDMSSKYKIHRPMVAYGLGGKLLYSKGLYTNYENYNTYINMINV